MTHQGNRINEYGKIIRYHGKKLNYQCKIVDYHIEIYSQWAKKDAVFIEYKVFTGLNKCAISLNYK